MDRAHAPQSQTAVESQALNCNPQKERRRETENNMEEGGMAGIAGKNWET